MSDARAFLASIEPFRNFGPAELEALASEATVRDFDDHDPIIVRGTTAEFLGIVLEGRVDIFVTDPSGEKRRVDTFGPGGLFGEMGLLSGDITTADVSAAGRVQVLLIPQKTFLERIMIKIDALRFLTRLMKQRLSAYREGGISDAGKSAPVLLEVSARHLHLSQTHLETLFGPGAVLHNEHELSQPGQYACAEKVNLVGPKGRIDGVRVLGPVRKQTQVEVAMTDTFKLGVKTPIRESGLLAATPGLVLEGPAGQVEIPEGLICALRHIHMTPEDAARFGLRDKDVVRVRVAGDRELIFGDTLVRANPNFRLAMHIDTDEANAANLKTGTTVFIESLQERGA